MSKELLKAAKISIGEFATLAGVSRVTVSLWVNKHAKPHDLHKEKIDALWTNVQYCINNGALPILANSKEAKLEKLSALLGVRP